jgi:hypothetical protein
MKTKKKHVFRTMLEKVCFLEFFLKSMSSRDIRTIGEVPSSWRQFLATVALPAAIIESVACPYLETRRFVHQ